MKARLRTNSSGARVRPWTLKDFPGYAVSVDTNRVALSSASDALVSDADAVFRRYQAESYYNEAVLSVEGLGFVQFASLTPQVAKISGAGETTRTASGIAQILVRNSKVAVQVGLDLLTKTGSAQADTLVSVYPESLAAHLSQAVDSRINSGMTIAANALIYTTQNHTTATYIRNPALWCADLDLTCISPWNSNAGKNKAGTLVTPRHAILAAHYPVSAGNTMRFVAMDGTVHTRTVLRTIIHPSYVPYFPDFQIVVFDSDLPAAITPCEVMPPDHGDYLVHTRYTRPGGFGLDQEEKALVADLFSPRSFQTPTGNRLLLFETKIVGDSGNPGFIIVNDKLVLFTVWTLGGAGGGTPVGDYVSDLDQMIVSVDTSAGISSVANPSWPNAGGHYRLKPADFSSFPALTAGVPPE